MYRTWARRRGASIRDLDRGALRESDAWAAVVQSFGAHTLLDPENGLHVLETPAQEGPRPQRHMVRVHVLPVPSHDPAQELALDLARRALAHPDDAMARNVVRRYREHPSPLVRDSVRGWRTGRLDRVWSGDFDLLAGVQN
jgi:ATP-dependent Clp protease ATP-binding subunit ClpC